MRKIILIMVVSLFVGLPAHAGTRVIMLGGGGGGVSGPSSTTENNIPQWDAATKTLKDGLGFATTLGDPGVDTNLVSEKAIRSAIQAAGGGDVSGPGAAVTDNAVTRWNGTGGTAIQNSGVIIDDSNNITGVAAITATSGAFGDVSNTELQYVNGVTSAIQTQLDARCLESVFGDTLSAELALNATTLGIAAAITRDTEWDTIGKIETATSVNILVSTELDSESELETLLADVSNVIVSTEIDTEGEFEAICGAANFIVSTEIDTFDELNTLVADQTLIHSGSTIAGANLNIHGTTAEASVASDDEVIIYDTSASANRRMTRSNFLSGVGGGGDQLVDIVATSPLLVNDTTNVNDALPGSDADITFSMPAATNSAHGYMTSTQVTALEAVTGGGISLDDTTPDEDGEIGYASNAFTIFANSESLSLTASEDTWTFGSGSGVTTLNFGTFAITNAGNISGGDLLSNDDIIVQDDIQMDSDGAILSFGEDNEVTLTHVADTGILLNAAMQMQFRDSGVYINSVNDGYLDLEADTGIRFNGPVTFANEGAITLPAGTAVGDTAFTDLTAGNNYTNYGDADDDTIDELFAAIDASWPSGSGAPTDASYLTAGANATLSDERVVSADGLSLVTAADFATMRTSMGLVIGTNVLAPDGNGSGLTSVNAATITIADNEDTNETNAILFTPGGDLDGGNLTPETDGDLNYNPSTGTLSAPAFASSAADGAHYLDIVNGTAITATASAGRIAYYNGYIWVSDADDWTTNYLLSNTSLTGNTETGISVTPQSDGTVDFEVSAALASIAGLTEADVSILETTADNTYNVVSSGGNNYILGSNADNSALEFKTPANVLSQIGGQASHAALTSIAGLTETAGGLIYATADNTYAVLGEGSNDGYVLAINTSTHAPYWKADATGAGGDQLVDIVATAPVLVNGTTNVDNVLPGSDADITFSIADDGIDSQHYAAGSIDNEHLADDAVDSDEIASGAIDLDHMSANSVDSDQYVDGSIDEAHIASNAVAKAKLKSDVFEDISGVNTGTATDEAVTADALAGSVYGTKDVGWALVDDDTDTAVAQCKKGFVVPASWNGMDIIDATASVHTTGGTSGATTVQLIRRRGATETNVFTTGVTVTYNEYTASDETVDTSNDDLQTGDVLYPNVTAIAGTAAKGLSFTILARKP